MPGRARVVEVAPERLAGWLERFEANNPDGPQRIVSVDRFDHDPLALILVRRGGYAVGLARGGRLTTYKVGTRYVQSRTAAGGWSQQRFARRRVNQADALVGAVIEHADRLLPAHIFRREPDRPTAGGGPHGVDRGGASPGRPTAGLVLGGDKALVAQVLTDPRLRWTNDLPLREFYDLPDPRLSVLDDALTRVRAVRVTITEVDFSP